MLESASEATATQTHKGFRTPFQCHFSTRQTILEGSSDSCLESFVGSRWWGGSWREARLCTPKRRRRRPSCHAPWSASTPRWPSWTFVLQGGASCTRRLPLLRCAAGFETRPGAYLRGCVCSRVAHHALIPFRCCWLLCSHRVFLLQCKLDRRRLIQRGFASRASMF